jgi:hypothetical protein
MCLPPLELQGQRQHVNNPPPPPPTPPFPYHLSTCVLFVIATLNLFSSCAIPLFRRYVKTLERAYVLQVSF